MKKPDEPQENELRQDTLRAKLIGLGERSIKKSYYPELKARRDQLERFRITLDKAGDAIFLLDANLTVVDANKTAGDLLSLPLSDILNQAFITLFPDARQERLNRFLHTPSSLDETKSIEIKALSNGQALTVELKLSFQEINTKQYAVVIARDVTTRKEIEEQLRHRVNEVTALNDLALSVNAASTEDAALKRALDIIVPSVTPDRAMFYVFEGDGVELKKEYIAPGFSNDAQGQFPPKGFPNLKNCTCSLSIRNQTPGYLNNICGDERCKANLCVKSGIHSIALLPLRLGDHPLGALILASHSVRDFEAEKAFLESLAAVISSGLENVTLKEQLTIQAKELSSRYETQKKAESELAKMNFRLEHMVRQRTEELNRKTNELEQAYLNLQELDKMKSVFLTTVSHDLRTPLTSVLGFVKLIQRDFERLMPELKTAGDSLKKRGVRIVSNLAIILEEAERLTRLINDFLDLSKIESGRMNWDDTLFNPTEVIQSSMPTLDGFFINKREVRFRAQFAQNLPQLYMDPDRFIQVLTNLVSNAAKYTENGEVLIRVDSSLNNDLVLQVQDSGQGIPPTELELIFDKFHQAKARDTIKSKPAGTGLGLAICKLIVGHYAGNITVESEEGKGSVFAVSIPGASV